MKLSNITLEGNYEIVLGKLEEILNSMEQCDSKKGIDVTSLSEFVLNESLLEESIKQAFHDGHVWDAAQSQRCLLYMQMLRMRARALVSGKPATKHASEELNEYVSNNRDIFGNLKIVE